VDGNEKENYWKCSFRKLLCLSGADRTHEKFSSLAVDTIDFQIGLLLIIKFCLCPIAFCNYICLNFGLFPMVLSFILPYIIHCLNSCKLTVDYLFFFHLAFL